MPITANQRLQALAAAAKDRLRASTAPQVSHAVSHRQTCLQSVTEPHWPPMPTSDEHPRDYYARQFDRICRRFGRDTALYFACLAPLRSRHFPSNYARLCWKSDMKWRRWLYRTNRPRYDALKQQEGWQGEEWE